MLNAGKTVIMPSSSTTRLQHLRRKDVIFYMDIKNKLNK